MQVKIFRTTDPSSVESVINDWLSKHSNIEIIKILQSECCFSNFSSEFRLTISIFYKVVDKS